MAFWSEHRWRTLGGSEKIVEPWDVSRVEDSNYLLSIGNEVYVSDEESAKTARQLKEGESFAIEPGQFAFLLTEETVHIPLNTLGFISIRASIKFSGLVNISGFHVDPGYRGKLLFSVFNAGPSRIHLKRGEPIFPIWLADLEQEISGRVPKKGYSALPSQNINQISGKFTTAYQVEKKLDEMQDEINKLKAFKLQAYVFVVIATALLLPMLKDSLVRLFQLGPGPAMTSQVVPPAKVPPTADAPLGSRPQPDPSPLPQGAPPSNK